jgi:hypothetical protein
VIQGHRISILAPLGVGVIAQVCPIIIHLMPVRATINLVRRENSLGHVGTPWTDLGIFARVVFYASLTHLLEMAFWAVLFIVCGEFSDFGTAFYHSTPKIIAVETPKSSVPFVVSRGPNNLQEGVMMRSP